MDLVATDGPSKGGWPFSGGVRPAGDGQRPHFCEHRRSQSCQWFKVVPTGTPSFSTTRGNARFCALRVKRLHDSTMGALSTTRFRASLQAFVVFAGGASATAASVVSRRNVNVSCRYKRTAASVWLR